jgi:hypothetical protein
MQLHADAFGFDYLIEKILLLGALTVAAHEAVNATGSVNELALTSIERVRGAGDFEFYQRVSFAFKFHCL